MKYKLLINLSFYKQDYCFVFSSDYQPVIIKKDKNFKY